MEGVYPLTRYEISDNSWHSDAWIWLVLLLAAGFAVWRLLSPLAALGIALLGLLLIVVIRYKGKKRVGGYVEVDDKIIIIGEKGENYCITFDEIKKVKTSRIFSLLGEPAFIIETSTGTRRWLQPDDYENSASLRKQLTQQLEKINPAL